MLYCSIPLSSKSLLQSTWWRISSFFLAIQLSVQIMAPNTLLPAAATPGSQSQTNNPQLAWLSLSQLILTQVNCMIQTTQVITWTHEYYSYYPKINPPLHSILTGWVARALIGCTVPRSCYNLLLFSNMVSIPHAPLPRSSFLQNQHPYCPLVTSWFFSF